MPCNRSKIEKRKEKKKYNRYDLSGEYGIGYTSSGEEFWFDKEDYNLIKEYCWYYSEGYLRTNITVGKGNQTHILFHRLVMNFPENEVDHIKHPQCGENKYDNRKSNLRIVSRSKNQMNKGLQKNNSTGVTGVSWHQRDRVWEASISINKKTIYLGSFKNKEDAINARKNAENRYFGEFSYTNSGNSHTTNNDVSS